MKNSQIITESSIVKIAKYEVNADNNRSFSSKNKSDVMSVAASYRKQGLSPQVYAVGDDAAGRVATHRIV